MKKLPFTVLAECADARSGKRFVPGDTFSPAPSVDQATRLVAAGCLPPTAVEEAQRVEDAGGVDLAEISRDQLNHDGLFDKSIEELHEIARAENVEPSDDEAKAHVVAVIRGHRARQTPRPAAFAIEQRTDAGQAQARAADAAATASATTAPGASTASVTPPASTTAPAPASAATDGLDAKGLEELRELAKAETIDLGELKKKPEIVAAIRAARAAKAA